MAGMDLHLTVNGEPQVFRIEPGDRLAAVLRREGYSGVKIGCGTGDCGSCTVLLNGEPVVSCILLAAQADGAEITTVVGLARDGELHPLQEAFLEEGAAQCGFCTPGILLTAKAFLDRNPDPTEEEIRDALSGNLCRCTGYVNIVRAVLLAAERMRGGTA